MDVGRPVEERVWKTQIFSIHTDYIVTLNVETTLFRNVKTNYINYTVLL